MEKLDLNIDKVFEFISKESIYKISDDVTGHIQALENKTGKGHEFLGWMNLPSSITDNEINEIEDTVHELGEKIEYFIVVGIGGSYLGAKAVIEALSDSFRKLKTKNSHPLVLFAGQNICEDYLSELLELLEDKSYAVCVISKSGTTTEPAIAFRFLREHLMHKYGEKEARKRIIAITDKSKGALRKLADAEGFKTFVIPDDVGGRYSVLTPVGLVPIAAAGFKIRDLLNGARYMEENTRSNIPFEDNPSAVYAAARNALYHYGKTIEILVNYTPKLRFISEWWKQLYGESEGKEQQGIFPTSVNNTTDLHSMGQYIQEGLRNNFETVISVKNPKHHLIIKEEKENLDGLNYLAGKKVDEVNKRAEEGTTMAHVEGGVPNLKINLPYVDEYYLGQLIYFFEKACAISGYVLGVNPFDQPGVEAYKKNMFKLLKKPGY